MWRRNYDNMLSRFHRILERNGQTDGTDGVFNVLKLSRNLKGSKKVLYQYRASVLTCDKKNDKIDKNDTPVIIFVAFIYARAQISYRQRDRPSVRLSHAGILTQTNDRRITRFVEVCFF